MIGDHYGIPYGNDIRADQLFWLYTCGHVRRRSQTSPSQLCPECDKGRLDSGLLLIEVVCDDCSAKVYYPVPDQVPPVRHGRFGGHHPRPVTEVAS